MFKFTEYDKEVFKVFKKPKLRWYLGKIAYGTPYFNPINFNGSILTIRRLTRRPKEEIGRLNAERPMLAGNFDYSNMPTVRRSKNTVIQLFGNYYYVEIGWPIKMGTTEFGWKIKFDTYRFEWPPAFYIFFFKWQLYVSPQSPTKNESYWEQILWFAHKCDCDINKARETWPWQNMLTKKSSWDERCLLESK
jgi:hypothetical protein